MAEGRHERIASDISYEGRRTCRIEILGKAVVVEHLDGGDRAGAQAQKSPEPKDTTPEGHHDLMDHVFLPLSPGVKRMNREWMRLAHPNKGGRECCVYPDTRSNRRPQE
jgi:hypothetical protein